jgi:transcriptional regulator with XRE-family HTH domain
MAVRTFLPYTKIVGKPLKQEYSFIPQTLGEHIRKKRIESGLSQRDVSIQLQLSKDCISLWETGRMYPQIHHYPAIFAFLGYYPFEHETGSVAGKLRQLLHCRGWNHVQCAKALGIDSGTVKRILNGKRTFKQKTENIAFRWSQLPEYLKQQYRLE